MRAPLWGGEAWKALNSLLFLSILLLERERDGDYIGYFPIKSSISLEEEEVRKVLDFTSVLGSTSPDIS